MPDVLFSAQTIQRQLVRLGAEIDATYSGRELVAVILLKGAFVFAADLVRQLTCHTEVEFARASSYSRGTTPDSLRWIAPQGVDARGYDILLIEDILDTGRTMEKAMEWAHSANPATVRTCVCINKKARREVDIEPDFSLFDIDDGFVVGYGMDIEEQFRYLPYIGILREEQ